MSSGKATRIRQAAKRAAAAALVEVSADAAAEVAAGVLRVGRSIQANIPPGMLYWQAPFQFVAEEMALHVCRQYEIPIERRDEVAAYLLAGFHEYVVALVEGFDGEHFELWTAAQAAREEGVIGS